MYELHARAGRLSVAFTPLEKSNECQRESKNVDAPIFSRNYDH